MKPIRVLSKGYHPLLGGVYITNGRTPPEVPIPDAVRAIARLYADWDYLTLCDQFRAFAFPLTVGMRLGGVLDADAPIQYVQSDVPGAGKSLMQNITAAIFGEVPFVPTVIRRGVGGLDETIAQGMLNGRLFIKLDNANDEVQSEYLAAATTHELMPARTPYRRIQEVEPGRHVFMINGHGTPNIAPELWRRFALVRVRKRPVGFLYNKYREGHLLKHVKAHQTFYLGCLYSIIRAWLQAGKPITDERRHSFTEWAQSLDWIMLNIFKTVCGLFDDYDSKGNPYPVIERHYSIAADDIFLNGIPS